MEYRQSVTATDDVRPDCLKSSEIQLLLSERRLPPARVAHIERCDECAIMVRTLAPTNVAFREFLTDVMRRGEAELSRRRGLLGDSGVGRTTSHLSGHLELRDGPSPLGQHKHCMA